MEKRIEEEKNKIMIGKLEYEGEYLNDEKNGKGKEYYSNGNIKFEGGYINGKNKKENIMNIILMKNFKLNGVYITIFDIKKNLYNKK